ncbi:serine/threonine-protein kinase pim-2-like [Chaetodon trifascialis]|uniref:serine/threonine-protein kinase pim-2-like n=1 Tax=Chaetodon trifascialis TaxID=109706 RepID=UPI00399509AC
MGHHTDPITHAVKDCTSDGRKKTSKRNSDESLEGSSKRRRTSSSEGCSQTSGPSTVSITNFRIEDAFEAKYKQLRKVLGQGGFGSVFAGLRRDDKLPVAIKRISQYSVERALMILDGKIRQVPLEVALMLQVKPAAGKTSAAVALLDWYDLDCELILILERPVPCMNLNEYTDLRKYMPEHEVKIIVKQLINALIEIHSRGVFHRDIKPQNILIETGFDVPRVRIIDFGCGTYLKKGQYSRFKGTWQFIPPEWYRFKCYRAEQMTVWQLGVVVFMILHGYLPFNDSRDIIRAKPVFRSDLSSYCQDFLFRCLIREEWLRPKLKELKKHIWLTRSRLNL